MKKKWIVVVLLCVLLALVSCSSDLMTGVGIGLAGGTAGAQAQSLAQQKKAALIEEILQLREKIDQAPTPEQKAALTAQVARFEKQKEIVEITDAASKAVLEIISRDWRTQDPEEQEGNVQYVVSGIFALLAAWSTRKAKIQQRSKDFAASKLPETQRTEVYDYQRKHENRILG